MLCFPLIILFIFFTVKVDSIPWVGDAKSKSKNKTKTIVHYHSPHKNKQISLQKYKASINFGSCNVFLLLLHMLKHQCDISLRKIRTCWAVFFFFFSPHGFVCHELVMQKSKQTSWYFQNSALLFTTKKYTNIYAKETYTNFGSCNVFLLPLHMSTHQSDISIRTIRICSPPPHWFCSPMVVDSWFGFSSILWHECWTKPKEIHV